MYTTLRPSGQDSLWINKFNKISFKFSASYFNSSVSYEDIDREGLPRCLIHKQANWREFSGVPQPFTGESQLSALRQYLFHGVAVLETDTNLPALFQTVWAPCISEASHVPLVVVTLPDDNQELHSSAGYTVCQFHSFSLPGLVN